MRADQRREEAFARISRQRPTLKITSWRSDSLLRAVLESGDRSGRVLEGLNFQRAGVKVK
jgi:hypothetical protein